MKHLLVACLLFMGAYVFGQDCHFTINGRVLDQHNKEVLSGATISIYGLNRELRTDAEGYFIFNGLCKGFIELEISHPSCGTQFIPLNITSNLEQVFYLEHHIETLQEVSLIQNKANKTTAARIISKEDLEAAAGENFAEALTKIQGISTLKTGNTISKPLIQGFYGSRVITSNQGVRMQDMEWGEEHAPNIATASVNKVSLVVGAEALKYGTDAVGGVLVLDPKTPHFKNDLHLQTSLAATANGRGIQASQSIDKDFENGLFIGTQIDYKKAGNTNTPEVYMENTGYEQLSLSMPFGYHKEAWGIDAYLSYFSATNAILRNSHIGNLEDLIGQINGSISIADPGFSYSINNPKQEVSHLLAKTAIYKRFSNIGKLDIQYDYQQNNRKEYDLRLGDRKNIPGTDLKLETHGIKTTFKVQTPETKTLEFGLDAKYQLHFPNPDTGVKRLIPDYNSHTIGAYIYGSTSLSEKISLSGAYRGELLEINADKYYKKTRWESLNYGALYPDFFVADFDTQILSAPSFRFNTHALALSSQYKTAHSSWKFHYQYVERAPNPAELFSEGLHHSAARIELGTLNLQKEKAHKWSLQLEYSKEKHRLFISPFFNYINDYIALIPTDIEFTIRGAFPVWEYQQTNAGFIGIDTKYSFLWTQGLESSHSLSIVKATDLVNHTPFPNIPPISTQHELEKKFISIPGLSLALNGQYSFRQNETPDNIKVYNPYNQTQSLLAINSAPAGFFLLGSSVAYAWQTKENNSYSLRLRGDNLTNNNYRNYLNRLRYFTEEMGLNVHLQFIIKY